MCFIFFFNAKEKNCFIWAFFLIFHLAVWMLILQKKKKNCHKGDLGHQICGVNFPMENSYDCRVQ